MMSFEVLSKWARKRYDDAIQGRPRIVLEALKKTGPKYKPCKILFFKGTSPPFIEGSLLYDIPVPAASSILTRKEAPISPDVRQGEDLLHQMHAKSPSIASSYLSRNTKDFATFRLLYPHGLPQTFSETSYVGLSYRWTKTVLRNNNYLSLPTSPLMFQGVLTDVEKGQGLWIDQMCIYQEDEKEKEAAIGMMDLIYAHAEYVIVLFDDVNLSKDEGESLVRYGNFDFAWGKFSQLSWWNEEKPPMVSQPHVFAATSKILSSKWFERAWCSHELRLAKEFIFLANYQDEDSKRCGLVRLYGSFLRSLIEHYLSSFPHMKPGSFPLNTVDVGSLLIWDLARPILDANASSQYWGPEFKEQESYIPFVLKTFFLTEAGGNNRIEDPDLRMIDALKDKLSIGLNVGRSGLVFQRDTLVPDRHVGIEVFRDLCIAHTLTIALLAGDPLALCTTGQNLRPMGLNRAASWLCVPAWDDYFRSMSIKLMDVSSIHRVESIIDNDYIELDVMRLQGPGREYSASQVLTLASRRFAAAVLTLTYENDYAKKHIEEWEGLCRRVGIANRENVGHLLGQTLEENTPRDAYRDRFLELLRGRTPLEHIDQALDEMDKVVDIVIATTTRLTNTLACILEMGSSWARGFQTRNIAFKRAAKSRIDAATAFETLWTDYDGLRALSSKKQALYFEAIWELVAYLIYESSPKRYKALWQPLWFPVGEGKSILSFAPRIDCTLVVPKCLLRDEHASLYRAWAVKTRQREDSNSSYSILGKVPTYANFSLEDMKEEGFTAGEERARFYAPTEEDDEGYVWRVDDLPEPLSKYDNPQREDRTLSRGLTYKG